jgi:hypothetical protein
MEADKIAHTWYSSALGVRSSIVMQLFLFLHVAHLFSKKKSSMYHRTPVLSSPAQTENGNGNNQRSKPPRRRPPIGGGGGGGGGSFKLDKPMKLQRIVSQSPAEDYETLTAEPSQRNRKESLASVSTERNTAPRPSRKFSRDEEKPAFAVGGRYAGDEHWRTAILDVENWHFLRLLFISLFLCLRFDCSV